MRLVNDHLGEYPLVTAASAAVAKQVGVGKESVRRWVVTRPRKTLGWKTPAEALDEHLRSLQQAGVATTD